MSCLHLAVTLLDPKVRLLELRRSVLAPSLARLSLLRDAQDLPREDPVRVLDPVAVRLQDRPPPLGIPQEALCDARQRVPGLYGVERETVVGVDQGHSEDDRDYHFVRLAPAPV